MENKKSSTFHKHIIRCTIVHAKQNYIKAHNYGHINGLTKGIGGGGDHILLLITPRRNPSAKMGTSEKCEFHKTNFLTLSNAITRSLTAFQKIIEPFLKILVFSK